MAEEQKIPEEALANLRGISGLTPQKEVRVRIIEFLRISSAHGFRRFNPSQLANFLNEANSSIRANRKGIEIILNSAQAKAMKIKSFNVAKGSARRNPPKKPRFPAAGSKPYRRLPR